jgi:glycerophosphoryl diester phosphodiesterase
LDTLFKISTTRLFILIALLSLNCSKNKYLVPANYNPIIIGHGGMGISHAYPINSLESLLLALNSGADGIEIDVQLTKDSELIAFHDRDLAQSTNGEGTVNENNWETISKLHYNFPIFAKYPLISLSQLFNTVTEADKYTFILDCKFYENEYDSLDIYNYCSKINTFITENELSENIIVEFNNIQLIKQFKELNKDQRLMFYGEFELALKTAIQYGLYAIDCDVEELNESQVKLAKEHQLIVSVYNSRNNVLNEKSIAIKADIIQTDALSHMLKLLE